MIEDPFLVTGATGTTGRAVVRELTARGHRVRALVRRRDDRSLALQALGAEVVEGDLLDLASLRSATAGVAGAYFACPTGPALVDASVRFAQASREAGLKIVANLSILPARADAASPESLGHWLSARVFESFGVPSTVLRPTFFMDNLFFVSPLIKQGRLVFPWKPSSVHRPISAADVAGVAVSVLENPARHAGKNYPLHGETAYSFIEIAALLSRVLGKEVVYKQESVTEVVEMMTAGGNAYLEKHFAATLLDYEMGIFQGTGDLVPQITSRPQITLQHFIERHRSAFI